MNNYISVGITGGIGSGKTYVCRILESMGYPVFYSDQEAKQIISSHPSAIKGIKNLFGEKAYQNGQLNRELLAEKIFANDELRGKMNDLVHPLVRSSFRSWAENKDNPIVFNEAAILFETSAYKNFDFTILVTAQEELRMARVLERDGTTIEQVKSRMKSQWPDNKKAQLADFVIVNNEKRPLLPQINYILKHLK